MSNNKKTTATQFLHARCTEQNKTAWTQAAQRSGLKLTQWIVKTLNKEAEKWTITD